MKKCPNCMEKTIPLKWVLFNRSSNPDGKCLRCSNCDARIRKSKWLIFHLFSLDLLVEGTLILIATAFLGKLLGSYGIAFFSALAVWTSLYFAVEYFAPLKIADESYCRGDMTRAGAFFALVFMAMLMGALLNCFIVQPVLGNGFCG
jgi:hypothetical protein